MPPDDANRALEILFKAYENVYLGNKTFSSTIRWVTLNSALFIFELVEEVLIPKLLFKNIEYKPKVDILYF